MAKLGSAEPGQKTPYFRDAATIIAEWPKHIFLQFPFRIFFVRVLAYRLVPMSDPSVFYVQDFQNVYSYVLYVL